MNESIFVDIDDTALEFADPFIEFHNEKYGTDLSREDMSDYDLSIILNCTSGEAVKRIEEFHQTILEVPEVPGATEVLRKLAEKYDIIFSTVRDPIVSDVTKQHLSIFSTGSIPFFKEIHHASPNESKEDFALSRNAVIAIDDKVSHCKAYRKAGIKTFLFDKDGKNNWSHDISDQELNELEIIRVKSWEEVLKEIFNILSF